MIKRKKKRIGFRRANLIPRTLETVSTGCSQETKLRFATLGTTTQSWCNLQWVVLMVEMLGYTEDGLRLTLHGEMEIIYTPKV